MFVTQHKCKITGLLAVLFLLINTTVASTPRLNDDGPSIKDQIAAVFERTSSSTTEEHFTAILDECERISALPDIHVSQSEYLATLTAWSYRRRGECRFVAAEAMFTESESLTEGTEALFLNAVEDFSAAIEGNNKPERCYRYRAMAACALGELEKAISDFTEAIALDPEHFSSFFNRAELYLATDDFQLAINDYNVVLEENSADLQALTGRAHALSGLNRLDEAMKDYTAVMILQSNDPVAIINRGDCFYAMGEFDLALADYKKSISIEPTPDNCRRAAWLTATCPVSKFHEPDYSVEMAQRALELGGETPDVLDTLAASHASNGDFESATESQLRAIEIFESGLPTSVVSGDELQQRLTLYESERPFRTTMSESTGTETGLDR
ncbi:MAG: tetratricopeptide repeat protein [Planctomycetota bacterium]